MRWWGVRREEALKRAHEAPLSHNATRYMQGTRPTEVRGNKAAAEIILKIRG